MKPVIFLCIVMGLSACKKPQPPPPNKPGDTKMLQAASLVGYDGKALQKSVDKLKDSNQKHNQELEKAVGNGN
ncbi:MAG: hypothetical protein ABI254_10040 [Chthoniobacterales bacterium]